MSLINEALKKARLEAARQEAADKGVPVDALPAHLPALERRVSPWPIVSGLLAIALILLLAWLAFRPAAPGGEPEVADSAPAAATPARAADALLAGATRSAAAASADRRPSSPPPTEEGAILERDAGAEPTRRDAAAAIAAPPAERRVPARGRDNPLSGRRLDFVDPPAPAAGDRAAGAGAGGAGTAASLAAPERVREMPADHRLLAKLEDGRQLKLAGIAWSQSNPFAVINGQMLSPGERIEGFEIIEIEPSSVTLSDGTRTIVLRSR